MKAGRYFPWLLMLTLLLAAAPALAGGGEDAAESWLALVDQGKYAQSWDQSDAFFKSKVGKDQWVQKLTQLRKPLGAVQRRELGRATPAADLPGTPPGKYLILDYNTDFAAKKGAGERVTMHQGGDGRWRMIGYFIMP